MKQKSIEKRWISIFYIFCVLYSSMVLSCDSPTDEIGVELPETEETPAVETEEEPVTEIEEIPDIEPQPKFTEEEEVMSEERVLSFFQLEEYKVYSVIGGRVYGLGVFEDKAYKEECFLRDEEYVNVPIDQFYKSGNDLFFSVKYMIQGDKIAGTDPAEYEAIEKIDYYKQSAGKLSTITEAEFQYPISEYVTLGSEKDYPGFFKILNEEYAGDPISMLYMGEWKEGWKKIDGYHLDGDSLWFSVSETLSTRYAGLYFIKKGSNKIKVGEYGRVW